MTSIEVYFLIAVLWMAAELATMATSRSEIRAYVEEFADFSPPVRSALLIAALQLVSTRRRRAWVTWLRKKADEKRKR